MKKMLAGLAAGGLMLMVSGAALADGMRHKSIKDDGPCCDVNWNGLYVGVAVGYGVVVSDMRHEAYDESYGYYNGGKLDGLGHRGFLGTVSIGYDRQIHDGLVIGIFGEFDFGKRDFDMESEYSDTAGYYYNRMKMEREHGWAIGGRLGFVRNCCTMIYGTVGYQSAEYKLKMDSEYYDGLNTYLTSYSGSKRMDGWFVGAGMETQLRDRLFLKMEYRYAQLDDDFKYDYAPYYANYKVDNHEHSIRFGLSYKFDFHRDHHEPMK